MKNCPNCGYEDNSSSSFCIECGYRVNPNVIKRIPQKKIEDLEIKDIRNIKGSKSNYPKAHYWLLIGSVFFNFLIVPQIAGIVTCIIVLDSYKLENSDKAWTIVALILHIIYTFSTLVLGYI